MSGHSFPPLQINYSLHQNISFFGYLKHNGDLIISGLGVLQCGNASVTVVVADDEFACLGNLVADQAGIKTSRTGRTNSHYSKQVSKLIT